MRRQRQMLGYTLCILLVINPSDLRDGHLRHNQRIQPKQHLIIAQIQRRTLWILEVSMISGAQAVEQLDLAKIERVLQDEHVGQTPPEFAWLPVDGLCTDRRGNGRGCGQMGSTTAGILRNVGQLELAEIFVVQVDVAVTGFYQCFALWKKRKRKNQSINQSISRLISGSNYH